GAGPLPVSTGAGFLLSGLPHPHAIIGTMTPTPQEVLVPSVERALGRLVQALGDARPGSIDPRLRAIAVASDFAVDTLVRQPRLLQRLLADDGAEPLDVPRLEPDGRQDWQAL